MKIANFNINYKYNNYLKTTNFKKSREASFKKDTVAFFGNYNDYDYEIQKLKDKNARLEAQIYSLKAQIEQNNAAIRKLEISKNEENKFLSKESIKTSLSYSKNLETINDAKKVLDYFGYNPRINEDGLLTIDSYKQPAKYTFEELGIDENKLFKFISEIKGDVDLENSNLENLGNLEIIEGNAYFGNVKQIETPYGIQTYSCKASKIKNLGKLQTIKGNAYFDGCEIKSLNNLSSIGGKASCKGSKIEDLGELVLVGGTLNILDTSIKNLGKLMFCNTIYHNNDSLDTKSFNAINFDASDDEEDEDF